MVILRSRTISLIIGILSLTIVNGQISESDGVLRNKLRMAEAMGIVEPGQYDKEIAKFEKSARETCDTNGGATAYDNAEKGLEKLVDCVMQILMSGQESGPATNQLDGQINQYCPMVQPLGNCIEQFTKSIDPCLDEKTRNIIKVLTRFTISVLSYGCENDGEHIKTFINDGGHACLDAHREPLTECFGLLAARESEATESETGSTKLSSIGPTLRNCEYFQDFERCVDEELKKCNKPSITEIGNHVVHLLYKESGCVEILSFAAAPTTIINSLLVITGIAMSL